MIQFNYFKTLALLFFGFGLYEVQTARAGDGSEVGNGDSTPFTMPKEEFAYSCSILFRVQEKSGAPFVWAKKAVRFSKAGFVISGGHDGVPASLASVTFVSEKDVWDLSTTPDQKVPSELPHSLVGYRVTLVLGMDRKNGSIAIPGVGVDLLIQGSLNQEESLETRSLSVPFESHLAFGADVSHSTKSEGSFLGLSAYCEKVSP